MKKNKSRLFLSALVAALLVLQSCMDLTEKPQTFLAPEFYFTTVAQCESAIVGALNCIQPFRDGEYFSGPPTFADGIRSRARLNYINTSYNGWWNTHYLAITNLNYVIKACTDGRMDETRADVKDVLGQAYFWRAFNYFSLVQFYGKVLWKDENTDFTINKPTPESRMEVEFLYDKIEQDFTKAFELMFDFNSARKARPCKWSAKAMLAKFYLTRATAPLKQTSNYAKAAAAAEEVIRCGHYNLLPFDQIFLSSNPDNAEYIIAFHYNDLFIGNPGTNFYLPGWPTTQPTQIGNPTVGAPYNLANYQFILDYPDQPRKHIYFGINWPMYIDHPEENWVWRYWDEPRPADGEDPRPGFYGRRNPQCLKYTWPNITIKQLMTIYGNYGGQLNPFLRITEMYLCYAEAANMDPNGNRQKAVDYLNLIIDRANKPFKSIFPLTNVEGKQERASLSWSKEYFNEKVWEERRWELCFEHTAYWDVLRFERLKQVNFLNKYPGYEDDKDDYFTPKDYLFPIPPRDAQTIGQNPGYP